MKAFLAYCSKMGNTKKVVESFLKGFGGGIDVLYLDFTPEGILKKYEKEFTLDLSSYDFICFAGWVMGMKVHPFLVGYIRSCEGLEGKDIVVILTGGSTLSREHALAHISEVLEKKKAKTFEFLYVPTLLGLTLTKRKLEKVSEFGRKMREVFKKGS